MKYIIFSTSSKEEILRDYNDTLVKNWDIDIDKSQTNT